METKLRSFNIDPGYVGHNKMPGSEVCLHMQIAGKVMEFELVRSATRMPHNNIVVQLYETRNHDGEDVRRKFSSPILPGEAGIFKKNERFCFTREEVASTPDFDKAYCIVKDLMRDPTILLKDFTVEVVNNPNYNPQHKIPVHPQAILVGKTALLAPDVREIGNKHPRTESSWNLRFGCMSHGTFTFWTVLDRMLTQFYSSIIDNKLETIQMCLMASEDEAVQ